MAAFKYTVSPFLGKLNAGENIQEVAKQLETLINRYSETGWEFVAVTSVDILVQPGCLAGLLGGKASTVGYNQVVFRAPIS
jgi:hypothetical protein